MTENDVSKEWSCDGQLHSFAWEKQEWTDSLTHCCIFFFFESVEQSHFPYEFKLHQGMPVLDSYLQTEGSKFNFHQFQSQGKWHQEVLSHTASSLTDSVSIKGPLYN